MSKELKPGDWVDALDGISKVIEVKHIYKENYPLASTSNNELELGDLLNIIVIYKIFCDFDGKLRKRNAIQHCSIKVCTPICNESQAVLDKLKKADQSSLAKFDNLTQKKPFRNNVTTWVMIPKPFEVGVLTAINKEFDKEAFTFNELINELRVKLKLDKTWCFFGNKTDEVSQVVLSLNNKNYSSKDKQLLFTDFSAEVF